MNVKLSKRFYLFSVVFGLLLGAFFSSVLIRPIAKSFVEPVDRSTYVYPSGKPNEYEYNNAVLKARDEASDKVSPFILLLGGALFVFLFVVVGRKRQPSRIDQEGVYVWDWFGKKKHLWSDFQDRSVIKVNSTGVKVAKFEQFHFTTGVVSVNTNRLEDGDVVLNKMSEMVRKA